MAIVFEEMRPQGAAILPVDDGAAGGAGVALVGGDQFQGMAEQIDMLVVERGHGGVPCANQADRIIAATNTGLEHEEFAFAFLEIEAGPRQTPPQSAPTAPPP